MTEHQAPSTAACRICGGTVTQFLDLGRQPLSDAFLDEARTGDEFSYRLAVGMCGRCTMVQLMEEVPRKLMFHEDYPYHSSGSAVMREHFAKTAKRFLETELTGSDPFIVEIGCNDGVMLGTVREAGVRHLGFEPSAGVAEVARAKGCGSARTSSKSGRPARCARPTARPTSSMPPTPSATSPTSTRSSGASTRCSRRAASPSSRTPTWATCWRRPPSTRSTTSISSSSRPGRCGRRRGASGSSWSTWSGCPSTGARFGTPSRGSARTPTAELARLLADEDARALTEPATLAAFAGSVGRIRNDLLALLRRLRDEGRRVVAYGATAKSATVTNFCGIGTDLVECVYDSTHAKQGRLTPGAHLPVRPPEEFAADRPDFALLFAWNHAAEIMAKERAFRDSRRPVAPLRPRGPGGVTAVRAERLAVEGAFAFAPRHPDGRGVFVSPYQESAFEEEVGHPLFPVAQASHSVSRKGWCAGSTTRPPRPAAPSTCTVLAAVFSTSSSTPGPGRPRSAAGTASSSIVITAPCTSRWASRTCSSRLRTRP